MVVMFFQLHKRMQKGSTIKIYDHYIKKGKQEIYSNIKQIKQLIDIYMEKNKLSSEDLNDNNLTTDQLIKLANNAGFKLIDKKIIGSDVNIILDKE